MPLLPILLTNPDQIYALQIQQIIALCGDGKLTDNTECSRELRQYLSQAPTEKLSLYIESCLQGLVDKNGSVLQDLVNELGRRLEYVVDNGLYQGRSNAIGNDGIWSSPDGHSLVIEVKTTDAYRINLDTIATYRDKLIQANRITKESSILIIVGREDTGDLEAQVRGSRHAWDIRLISVDALIKLVKLKEETEEVTTKKIRELLVPFEYTKLDKIIDVAFTAVESAGQIAEEQISLDIQGTGDPINQEHTPREILDSVRQRIIGAISKRESTPLVRRSAALYWSVDPNKTIRVACSVSKQHKRGIYWYAYHPSWDSFLEEARKAFYVLGCIGRDEAYALPFAWIHDKLPSLYTTERGTRKYWHIYLEEGPDRGLVFPLKTGKKMPVSAFRVDLP